MLIPVKIKNLKIKISKLFNFLNFNNSFNKSQVINITQVDYIEKLEQKMQVWNIQYKDSNTLPTPDEFNIAEKIFLDAVQKNPQHEIVNQFISLGTMYYTNLIAQEKAKGKNTIIYETRLKKYLDRNFTNF